MIYSCSVIAERPLLRLPDTVRHLVNLQGDLANIITGNAPLHQREWEPADFDLLTFQPKVTWHNLPGLENGVYLNRPDFDSRMIPSPDLYKRIVYANCESYEDLKNGTIDKIKSLATGFRLRDRYDIKCQLPLTAESFSPDNVLNALTIVEQSMVGQRRRTGEESFAHILRTVLQATELISLNNSDYNSGKNVVPFTARTAELLLLLCTLHDFTEEDTAKDGRKKIKFGEMDENIIMLPDGNCQVTFHPNTTGVSDLHLLLDQSQLIPLINGIKALNSSGLSDEEQFDLLRRIPVTSNKNLPLLKWRDELLYFLPFLVKILDRLDNLRTYQFTADSDYDPFWNRRKPQLKDKIVTKMNTTIDFFERAENYLAFILTDDNPKKTNFEALRSGVLYLYTRDWNQETFFDRRIARLRPSRLALEILLGLSPEEIFRENDRNKPGPWILQPI